MSDNSQAINALVYRGRDTCRGCAEAVYDLLNNFPTYNITPSYVGPKEDVSLTDANVFQGVTVFAIPGGPDLNTAWQDLKGTDQVVRDFISNGGRYLGFCLGAFLAGNGTYNFLPAGNFVTREVLQSGSQVQNTSDSMLQVNWSYSTGVNASQTHNDQWMYFQDGAAMGISNTTDLSILGRYSSNGNVSATLSKYGKGWVGLIGTHPEAQRSWYTSDGFENPEGIHFAIGNDFLAATLNGNISNTTTPPATPTIPNQPSATGNMGHQAFQPLASSAFLLVLFSWLFHLL